MSIQSAPARTAANAPEASAREHTSSPAARPLFHWISLVVLALGLALIVLDGTIVGVSLPVIIKDLSLNLSMTEWVNAIYSVVFAALLIGFGTLGDRVGRKTVFLTGIAIFMAGSAAAALATTGHLLLAGRFIQGIGGAMVLPSSLSQVNALFRGKDRAIAFGVWGATMAGAAAIGPLLGGWLTTSYTWHWIFWVNIPAGLAVLIAGFATLEQSRGRRDPGFDWLGLALSIVGIGTLVFAVIEGSNLGWLTPKKDFSVFGLTWDTDRPMSIIPIIAAVGIALCMAFIAVEYLRARRGVPVLVNLSLFQTKTFSWGNVAVLTVGLGEFVVVLVVPLYLVTVLELSTMQAGWVLASLALGAFLSGMLARTLSARFGASRVVIFGLATEILGLLATMALLSPTQSPALIALPLTLYGFGLGLAAAQLTSTVLRDIPAEISGQASAIQSTIRQLGASLGAALGGSMLATGAHHFMTQKLQALNGMTSAMTSKLADATTDSVGATILAWDGASRPPFGPQTHDILLALREGFTLGTDTALGVAAIFLALGLIGSINLSRHAHSKRRSR